MTRDQISGLSLLTLTIALAYQLGCGISSLLAVGIVATYSAVVWLARHAQSGTSEPRFLIAAAAGGVLAQVMGGLVFAWGATLGYSFLASLTIWTAVFASGALCGVVAAAFDHAAAPSTIPHAG